MRQKPGLAASFIKPRELAKMKLDYTTINPDHSGYDQLEILRHSCNYN